MRTRQSHAAAIAALCLFAQVFGLAHLLVVQHVECAAHGEMVHVPRGGRSTTSSIASRSTNPRTALLVDADRRGAALDSHEHCAWLSEARAVRSQRTPTLAAAVVTPTSTVAPLVERGVVPARPLYRLAPKVSPPRLAVTSHPSVS